ncbi:hypothetical protein OF83DRAFT_1063460, partial [Amylostereum chailletii]
YKVHKSTLALHATFFRDLFDGPQTAFDTASERYDGVPVMDMQDAAEDVEDFLKAIYFPDYTHRHGRKPTGEPFWSNFPGMYAGILRLVQKYDAPKIRQILVDAIKKEWPSNLCVWDKRQHQFQTDKDECVGKGIDPDGFHSEPVALTRWHGHISQTIRIAMELDIPEVLPVAFYDIYRTTEYNQLHDRISHHVDLFRLTVDDFCKLTEGRKSMRKYVTSSLPMSLIKTKPTQFCEGVWDDDIEHCAETDPKVQAKIMKSPCLKVIRTLRQNISTSARCARDVLANMKQSIDDLGSASLCSSCCEDLEESMKSLRQQLWAELPDIFMVVRGAFAS